MATIVRGTVPAEELALHDALQAFPAVEIECERIVQSGDDVIMPLLWVRESDLEAFDDALEDDPTVEDVALLSEFEAEALYQMKWIDRVHLFLHILTNGEATILDAFGRADTWHVRVLYPDRDHFSRTHDFAEDHQLTFDVESIRELEGEPAGRYGLTDGQYRALVSAFRRGYFEVPRTADLGEVADGLDISHQSLSEQLRRGTGALIEDTLMIGESTDDG